MGKIVSPTRLKNYQDGNGKHGAWVLRYIL